MQEDTKIVLNILHMLMTMMDSGDVDISDLIASSKLLVL